MKQYELGLLIVLLVAGIGFYCLPKEDEFIVEDVVEEIVEADPEIIEAVL
jgi:hypothetical protein